MANLFREAIDQQRQSKDGIEYRLAIDGLEYDIELPFVSIEMVDKSVLNWFERDQPMYLVEGEDKRKKIEVVRSTAERWAMMQEMEHLRDVNGTLNLPLISVMRQNVTPIYERTAAVDKHGSNNIKLFVREYVNPRSKRKEYVLEWEAKEKKSIVEVIEIQPPKMCLITYSVMFWANYAEDLGLMLQHMLQNFGDKHDVYYSENLFFFARLGGIENSSNDEDISGAERVFRTNFVIEVEAFLVDRKTITPRRTIQAMRFEAGEAMVIGDDAVALANRIKWYSPYRLQR